MAQKKSYFRRKWRDPVMNAIVEAILAAGGDEEDMVRLESLAPEIAALSIAARPLKQDVAEEPSSFIEKVEVLGWIELNPSIPFEERLRLCHFEGGVHKNITAKTSILKRRVRRLIVLYDPGGPVSTEDMRKRIKNAGDRPCDIDDGTGIGKIYPQRQVINPLPLLDEGQEYHDLKGYQSIPVLCLAGNKRALDLFRSTVGWLGRYLFPAVREEKFLDP
jgi:hypothetical protein